MRAERIEFLDKFIEALLLLEQVVARRSRRLGFERAMHALMSTVFLRVCWSNALRCDAEAKPVDRELGEACEAGACEGNSVVRAHHRRQSVRPEHLFADIASSIVADSPHAFAADDEAAELVGDG